MSLQFFNAVGKRETKKVDAATVMLEPTRGNFRIYPEIAKLLGLKDGSFVTVQEADVEGNGKMTVFIGKGKDGVVKVDENGQELTDKRGRKVYETNGFGASIREVTAGSNVFRFSVSSAWETLDGDTEKRKYFKLGEGMEVSLPMEDGGVHTTILYPLSFVKDEPKLKRGEKDDVDEAVLGDTAELSAEVASDFQEEEL